MAKVQLDPAFMKWSGELGNFVYVSRGKTVVDGVVIKDSYQIVRQKGVRTAPFTQKQINVQTAFQIVKDKWNLLKANATALASWQDQANALEVELNRDSITSHQVFVSYFMEKYFDTLGSMVTPADISDGTSLSYADRGTRVWS
ncbi:MAG: hypothetical protein OEZ36_05885 [Spirochaetota bacterium]|nr:hypothetical protein [Spirochaetota bacterium]